MDFLSALDLLVKRKSVIGIRRPQWNLPDFITIFDENTYLEALNRERVILQYPDLLEEDWEVVEIRGSVYGSD